MAQPSLPRQPKTIVLVVDTLDADDVTGLLERIRPPIVRGEVTTILCDLARLTDADMATIDALARLALRARRLGCGVRLRAASPELIALLAFAGLGDVLPCAATSGVEVVGQPEQREEPLGVQEERDPADPPIA